LHQVQVFGPERSVAADLQVDAVRRMVSGQLMSAG
jgi:hypothetical protein